MELKDWVKAARKSKKLTLEQLGEQIGRSKANVGHWETGKHNPSYEQLLQISDITGYPMPGNTEQANTPRGSNVSDGPIIKGEVPLISWVQAGDWNDAEDPFQPGDAEKWMPCPVNHSESTYALRVRGDSMTAQHGRSYPEGCIIYVDPEKRMPVNGTRIVAKLEGSNDVTFKVYKNEDGRQWLQPLNPQHPPIFDQFKVLGTVIGKWEDE